MSNTYFISGQYSLSSDFDPQKLTDEQLQAHIERTLKQLQSINQELYAIWSHPRKDQEQLFLRRQFSELSEQLEYSLQEWNTRQISMR